MGNMLLTQRNLIVVPIQHVVVVQVAYYTNAIVDDLESGKTFTGV